MCTLVAWAPPGGSLAFSLVVVGGSGWEGAVIVDSWVSVEVIVGVVSLVAVSSA